MELEAIAALAKMFNLPQHLGHLTSGGTFANLEALWVSGQLNSGKTIAASTQAHYTHSRITSVLNLPFAAIETDNQGRMDIPSLEQALKTQNVGTVVATLGTTATGAVDPLDQILALQQQYKFRIHVDAAYGGYFTLASNLSPETRAAFAAIPQADSIVIDPHKHGLQPYGCGAILFRDPTVGRLYKHDSPYTYFSSPHLHLGEISLECSRAGASAVALWATQRLLPYTPAGEFARNLEASRQAALNLHQRLASDPRFLTLAAPPQLDIVCWAIAAPTPSASSTLAQAIFTAAAKLDLHLALTTLPLHLFPASAWPDHIYRSEKVTCLRSVLMKPEHLLWLEQIWQRLTAAASSQIPVNPSFAPPFEPI
jgi:tyrosine decarboxylase / aspartate 1-decarboxylase